MGKSRVRQALTTIALLGEGDDEVDFLNRVKALLQKTNHHVIVDNANGGSESSIIQRAIQHYNYYDRVLVLLDNDKNCENTPFAMIGDDEVRELLEEKWQLPKKTLQNVPLAECQQKNIKHNKKPKNPILCVATPIMFEGLFLRLFGITPCETQLDINDKNRHKQQKTDLKNQYQEQLKGQTLTEYLNKNLDKETLLKMANEIPQIALLRDIF